MQNVTFYHNVLHFTTECGNPWITLLQTTKYSILLQNIVVYHEKIIFYYKMWYFTTECSNSMGYTIKNSSILLQSYHKI